MLITSGRNLGINLVKGNDVLAGWSDFISTLMQMMQVVFVSTPGKGGALCVGRYGLVSEKFRSVLDLGFLGLLLIGSV